MVPVVLDSPIFVVDVESNDCVIGIWMSFNETNLVFDDLNKVLPHVEIIHSLRTGNGNDDDLVGIPSIVTALLLHHV